MRAMILAYYSFRPAVSIGVFFVGRLSGDIKAENYEDGRKGIGGGMGCIGQYDQAACGHSHKHLEAVRPNCRQGDPRYPGGRLISIHGSAPFF